MSFRSNNYFIRCTEGRQLQGGFKYCQAEVWHKGYRGLILVVWKKATVSIQSLIDAVQLLDDLLFHSFPLESGLECPLLKNSHFEVVEWMAWQVEVLGNWLLLVIVPDVEFVAVHPLP